jgi:hypothetical protein
LYLLVVRKIHSRCNDCWSNMIGDLLHVICCFSTQPDKKNRIKLKPVHCPAYQTATITIHNLSRSLSLTQFQNQLFSNQNDECLPTWRRKNWPQKVSILRIRVGSPDTIFRQWWNRGMITITQFGSSAGCSIQYRFYYVTVFKLKSADFPLKVVLGFVHPNLKYQ